MKSFKSFCTFLIVIAGILGVSFTNFVKINANSSISNQNIFISEISFGGSNASNNCKNEIGENNEKVEKSIENMCNFDKWIEIYNPSENTVNLSGYRVVVQNGLNQILSGQILPKSFLVLSNADYKYQNSQKIEETFVPKYTKKEFESEKTEDKKSENSSQSSSQKSESKLDNSSQSSSQNSENGKNNSQNKTNSTISQIQNSNDNSSQKQQNANPNYTNYSQNNNSVLTVSNSSISNSNPNSTESNSQNLSSQNNSQTLNFDPTNKPNLTIELKNEVTTSKTLDFDIEKTPNLILQNSQIFLQIDPDSIDFKQKEFIKINFQMTRKNNKLETPNSNITNQQKQQLFEQNIRWILQKRTETKLNSVLSQGGFANNSLGILHSISPNYPVITIKNPQNQVISSRNFTANWNNQNRYTAEFESIDSSPIQATNLYFETTNFGTPGFGKIKEKEIVKIPQNSTNLTTNLPVNSQLENTKENVTNTEKNLQKQAQTESQIETQKKSQKVLEEGKLRIQNEFVQNEINSSNQIQIPNYHLNTNQIAQTNPQFQEKFQPDLQRDLQLQNKKKNAFGQKLENKAEDRLENNLQTVTGLSQKFPQESSNLASNPINVDTIKNSQNILWYNHLSQNSKLEIFIKNQNIQNYQIPNTLQKLAKISQIIKNQITSENHTKIISPMYNLGNSVQNNTISGQIFVFKTDSILNFFINLLLLLLAIRNKENSKQNGDKITQNSSQNNKQTNLQNLFKINTNLTFSH